MLILEKKKDIYILKSMGATAKIIKNIVMAEGILISGIGSVTGILFAILILLAQQYFGLVGLPGSTFIVEAYPVIIKGTDLLLVFTTVTIVSFITVWYPARLAAKRF
jgi:ABC-type lipoprotein release transport system permease subunit